MRRLGHEDAGIDGDAQTVKFGPAENGFQRPAVDPIRDHGGEVGWRGGGGEKQIGFVFGEHAAGRAKFCDDVGVHRRGRVRG